MTVPPLERSAGSMKIGKMNLRYASFVAALVLVGCTANTQRAPAVPTGPTAYRNDRFPKTRIPLLSVTPDNMALERLSLNPVSSQPWMQGPKRPPESLADLGLKGRLCLVKYGNPRWEAHDIVIMDERGRMFAFCATIISPYSPGDDAFILGTTRATKSALQVKPDSRSYSFLFDLIWSFADDPRYHFTKRQAEILRTSMHLTDEEFEIITHKPRW